MTYITDIYLAILILIGTTVGFLIGSNFLFIKSFFTNRKWNKFIKSLNTLELDESMFVKRISDIIYFKIDNIYLYIYFNNDLSYKKLTICSDSSYNEHLYSQSLDDPFNTNEKVIDVFIDDLLEFFNDEINDVINVGGCLYSSRIVKEQMKLYTDHINSEIDKLNYNANLEVNEDGEFYTILKEKDEQQKEVYHVNDILDQILEKGIESLSKEQLDFLEDHTKN